MLNVAELTFMPLVEVLVDGEVAETIANVGVEQSMTGTADTLTHALIVTATPSRNYLVQDLELLAVVKVCRGDRVVARLTACFLPEQHQFGPYDVLKDEVTMFSLQDTLCATSHYTRVWPRMWTHMKMEINMCALSSLLAA